MSALAPSIDSILPLLREGKSFILTTHGNPDGDGLGSELALAAWLSGHGKQASIINHSVTPAVYRFMDPERLIRLYDARRDAESVRGADVIMVLDTNQLERLFSMASAVRENRGITVCIDHHLEAAPFAKHYVIDEDATSTAEIIYRILTRLDNRSLSPFIARALYCAIMTDTGSFRYPRVDPEIHRMIAHLIECGADPVAIYSEVYERWSAGRIHLLGEMLSALERAGNGKIAHVSITREMLKRTGTEEEDTDNFTTYPMSVEGVLIGILFLELSRGLKISFRSKGDIPVNELAKEFGGNGHRNAAGAQIHDGTLAETRQKVLSAALKYIDAATEGTA
jgi:phosphoesterase RecJ-like protein